MDVCKNFTIVVDGRKIRTQRKCLEEKSDYFRALFSSGLRESITNSVKIQSIDVSTMRQIIAYCESDHVVVYDENAFQLLAASDRLLMASLKSRVEDYLVKNISPENVSATFSAAVLCNAQELKDNCAKYVCWYLEHMLPFLTADSYDLVKYILGNDFVHWNENLLFKVVMTASQGKSASDLADLMEMLYLDNVTISSDSLNLYRAVSTKEGCRKHCSTLGIITEDRVMYSWCRRSSKLKRLTALPVKNTGFALERCYQHMYLFGGESRIGFGSWNMAVYRYDAVTNRWESFAEMNDCRRSCQAIVADSKIYLFHGYGKYRVDLGSNVAVFDTETKKWSKTNYTFRQAHVPCNGLIYLNGCFYHLVRTSTVYKFNERQLAAGSGEVLEMAGVPLLVISHAFVCGSMIVAISNRNEVILWDPKSNKAQLLESLDEHCTLYCQMIDTSLYIVDDTKLIEYAVDLKRRQVSRRGEYQLYDGMEHLNVYGICVVPYF